MPLMRKPEMYYYAAECYNNLNNPQKAVDALNAVRVARGILYEEKPARLLGARRKSAGKYRKNGKRSLQEKSNCSSITNDWG